MSQTKPPLVPELSDIESRKLRIAVQVFNTECEQEALLLDKDVQALARTMGYTETRRRHFAKSLIEMAIVARRLNSFEALEYELAKYLRKYPQQLRRRTRTP